jgi:hypothetical protein
MIFGSRFVVLGLLATTATIMMAMMVAGDDEEATAAGQRHACPRPHEVWSETGACCQASCPNPGNICNKVNFFFNSIKPTFRIVITLQVVAILSQL